MVGSHSAKGSLGFQRALSGDQGFRGAQGYDMLIIPGTGLRTDAFGLHRWGRKSNLHPSLRMAVCSQAPLLSVTA
jgi:hypothetical protein